MSIPEKTNWNNKAFSGFKSGFKAFSGLGKVSANKKDGYSKTGYNKGQSSEMVSKFRKRRGKDSLFSRFFPKKLVSPFAGQRRSSAGSNNQTGLSRIRHSDGNSAKPKIKVNPKYKRRYWFVFTAVQAILKRAKYLILIIGAILFILFFYALTQTNLFKVKEIRFEGVSQIDQSKLAQIATKYKGKNIYMVNLTTLEKDTAKTSVYIKSVYARKEIPSRLVVEIKERYPNLVLITLDGVYLVDKDNVVIAIPIKKQISFTDDEWQAYYTQNTELEIVKKRVEANLQKAKTTTGGTTGAATGTNGATASSSTGQTTIDSQYLDDKGKFDYSKVPAKEKENALKEIKKEMDQIMASHFKELDQQVNSAEYAGLTRMYVYQNTDYKEGKRIDSSMLAYTIKVLDYFNREQQFTITGVIWQTEFTLHIKTAEKKDFYFGLNRDIDTQIRDLDILMKHLVETKQKYKMIDLRTENITVK